MFDFLPKTHNEGANKPANLFVFALSTCGFCKSAIEFLSQNDVSYDYIYVDNLSVEEKTRLREEFFKRFNTRLVYPTLVVDEKDVIKGFIKPSWEQVIGL